MKNRLASFIAKLFPAGKKNEDKVALLEFVQNFYHGEVLPVGEAQRRVENGVVELLYGDGSHRGNGLLITENGYFVTAQHCLAGKDALRIRTASGNIVPISCRCMEDPQLEIALAKAELGGNASPKLYQFFRADKSSPSRQKPAVLLIRRNGSIQLKGGSTNGVFQQYDYKLNGAQIINSAICDIDVRPGDSGGIVVTHEGKVMGIMSARYPGEDTFSVMASWYEALLLIVKYAMKMK